MGSWRTHTDLWILSALVAGLFAFQQGDRVLAAVRPRLSVFANNVTSRLASFTLAPESGNAASEAAPSDSGEAETTVFRAAPQPNRQITIVPTVRRTPEAVEFRRIPRVVFRPVGGDPCDRGCTW